MRAPKKKPVRPAKESDGSKWNDYRDTGSGREAKTPYPVDDPRQGQTPATQDPDWINRDWKDRKDDRH
jgi:hypothetical protein